ncbi:MAG TPA: MFS transporter [Parvibaculum sp.]
MTAPEGFAATADMAVHEQAARNQRLRLYLGGQASWYVSLGIQFVLFPYLVTNVLHESAAKVGIAQMSLMAPSILFMLLGGATADHSDVRRILIRVHLLAALPPLILALVFETAHLSYAMLIAYALAMGTLGAFAMPARDSALTRVAGSGIQQAVTLAMGTQLFTQLLGMLLASFAAATGAPALLVFQMAIMLAGAWLTARLAALPPSQTGTGEGRLAQIIDGIQTARRSEIIIMVIAAMFAVGVFYVGSFMVVLPLMVRDIYHGGVRDLSLVNICFWGGTIVATFALLRLGHIVRRGRMMMASLMSGLVILTLLSVPLPFAAICVLSFVWGIGAGTTMTMGRTIVQLSAPDSHRARVLAFYQLGFSGGAPIGSVIMGFLVGGLGARHAVLVPAAAMVLVLIALFFFSPLWRYRAAEG